MKTITKELVRQLLPHRPPDGHKGTFGKVYVLGGAVGYTGAPVFAGEAAVRTGSGLVFAGVPESVYAIVAARCTCVMAQPIPEDYPVLLARLQACSAVCIGPGLEPGPRAEQTVLSLLRDLSCPVVLDAGGINAVAAHIDVLEERKAPTAVTPHDGEFQRLCGTVRQDREQSAAEFAARYGCVLVRKGPGTIVAAPDGRRLRNPTGNCGMAKGGSGDVLAGMILSLLGQGAEPFEAAAAAVWLHGRAGDLCARELTEYAMTPADLIDRLPAVFRELEMEN
ncbi:MAG: NAD(P)H-hydrate dehydratase [Oscillospiraceae bacterium]|nr:NAD(P)H-hydrate dehydratase [Oscillospiraceae bacterium]